MSIVTTFSAMRRRRRSARGAEVSLPFTYVCLELQAPGLTRDVRDRLEAHGLECLMEAGEQRAYAVAPAAHGAIDRVRMDPAVLEIHAEEPPCGK